MKKFKMNRSSKTQADVKPPLDESTLLRRNQRLEWLAQALLLSLGLYLAVAYFGQKAVPNSDFTAFVRVGQEIAHFQVPSSFKRVPMLGLLQIFTANFVCDSPHPVFTAGLLVNAVLYAVGIVLLYKISRFLFEPTGAFCLSFIAALNPWTLAMLVDPIVETTLVFFVLLTFYLMLKRSWWCYMAAMLASMTRYEGFVLIGIAFLLDLVLRKSKREKLMALAFCFLAALPMLLWLVGMKLQPSAPGGHYFRVLLNVEHRNGFDLFKMLWQTSFSSLLQWPDWLNVALGERVSQQAAQQITSQNNLLHAIINGAAAFFFVLGCVFFVIKKQWKYLAILLFWLVYVFVHAMQSVLLDRYTVPVIWLTLFIAAYGLKLALEFISKRTEPVAANFLLIPAIVITLVWLLKLWPLLCRTGPVSPASQTIIDAGAIGLICFFIGKAVLGFRSQWVRLISLCLCVGLFIVSNHFSLAFRLGRGDTDIEFKKLALWYAANAREGDKLVTTLPSVAQLFVPEKMRPHIIHINSVPANNIAEFAAACKKMNIEYVAWDSRLGFAKNDYYYKDWGLQKIAPLAAGKDVGPFALVQKFDGSRSRYLYLYRSDN